MQSCRAMAQKRGDRMKITTYRAEATGVTWFAIENCRYITPWCMSLLEAIGCWLKGEKYKKKDA